MKSYLKFVNAIDLRKLHVVIKQGLSDDVQDTQPLHRKWKKRNRMRFYIVCINQRAGVVYSYRGEDETLGPRVSHLNLFQCSHDCLHFGGMASLRNTGWTNEVVKMPHFGFNYNRFPKFDLPRQVCSGPHWTTER